MGRGVMIAGREGREGSAAGARDRRILSFLATIVGGLLVDQSSKWLAMSHLPHPQEPATHFGLSLTHNPGLLASVGGAVPLLVQAFTVALLGVAAISAASLLSSSRSRPRQLFALALLLSGGLGNLLDRMTTGGVVDFLQVGCLTLNVADLLLLAGGLLYGDPFHQSQSAPQWTAPEAPAAAAVSTRTWAANAESAPFRAKTAVSALATEPVAAPRGSRFRRVDRRSASR